MCTSDTQVTFPRPGIIRVESRSLFADPDGPSCRRFVEQAFRVPSVNGVMIGGTPPAADLRYSPRLTGLREVVTALIRRLDPAGVGQESSSETSFRISPPITARDFRGTVRYYRVGSVVGGWEVLSELPGRLRLRNHVLLRRSPLCRAIERELTGVAGVDRFNASAITGTVLLNYDPSQWSKPQLIDVLDSALLRSEHPERPDQPDTHLPICTASLPLAAAAQFAAPPLLPVAAAVFAYTAIPTFKEARRVLKEEKRLGVDALDSVVVVGCLGTLSIFPGAVCCWCLSFGRTLVKKTRENSQKLLLDAFGKQARHAWLYRDGVEVQVLAESLQKSDVVVVHTGETVPADGHVVDGVAMIDQHALTGEATPVEKGIGDRAFASTVLVGGKVHVAVEQSGQETASARINQILRDTAGYRLSTQHKGERLADKAVLPTLAAGALGMATMGPVGAVAVLNSDLGTGIRMAAPLAMLSTLTLSAHRGILIKDGRALEQINAVDTVLFDKTGTLTRERPEVGRVLPMAGFSPEDILGLAAAAERRFHHPIALAILHRAEELGLELPTTDDTQYQVGYGITVRIAGRTVRVGSRRFMELEGVDLPAEIHEELDRCHRDGSTMVMVGVDGRLGGAIELRAAIRPEAGEIIRGLRGRGIRYIAIISGDHEAPTRKLAESLGMDRYFAQVLPADKAGIVERLQKEGRKVCFVGDGINDSIALKKADVSISLRGASTIATDTAQVIFLEGGLSRLCELRDIARDLDRNVNRSWSMIVAPNVSNVIGVFTMGFGIMASVITNNVSALAALGNGLLPLRKIPRAPSRRLAGKRGVPMGIRAGDGHPPRTYPARREGETPAERSCTGLSNERPSIDARGDGPAHLAIRQ
jgi:Cu2+-exporting ATPase